MRDAAASARLTGENRIAPDMQKMARGIVYPVIDTEVTFDGIATALERMESRQIFGKIVLRLD